MNIQVERDDDGILAVYVALKEGEVARTVEIAEGECYADEDERGNLLGVEMLAPGNLTLSIAQISEHYTDPAVRFALDQVLDTVKV